jgi:DMSO reductase family type II enzyme heme b subunit
MRFVIKSVVALALLVQLAAVGCKKAPTVSNEVVAIAVPSVSLDPEDALWMQAPECTAALLLQDVADPRLMKASTPDVRVRAITNGSEIGFRIQWMDSGADDRPGPGMSVDACAVQLPRIIEVNPPAPQMGEALRPVDVTFWRADWQAWVNGRGDTIQDLYPNAAVDHNPFDARALGSGSAAQKEMAMRYAPALALGNRRNGPRATPVEDMQAEGPGTLKANPGGGSNGKGVRTQDGWLVVLSRPLPAGLAPRARTQVAFAVWEGAQGEIGSRKMRTGWIPLLRK